MKMPSIAVIIVNYNGSGYVHKAVGSALQQQYDGKMEIIVVDNASTDDSLAQLRATSGIKLVENAKNTGFGAGVNAGIRSTEHDFIALLNPDAYAKPQWLATTVRWMCEGDVHLASSVISAGRDTWFARGRFVEMLGTTFVQRNTGKTDWVSGCALIASRSAMDILAGFDEQFFLYYEDVDLSLRARAAGLNVRVLAETLVDHPEHGRSTTGLGRHKSEIAFYSRGRLIAKHVHGWRVVTALALAIASIPVRLGPDAISIAAATRSLFRGFSSATSRDAKTVFKRSREA